MGTRNWYVYILSNYTRTVLYVGITNNITRRMIEHRSGETQGFASQYRTKFLMHYEIFDDPMSAIRREKQIKGLTRDKKDMLIYSDNPSWKDLSADWTT